MAQVKPLLEAMGRGVVDMGPLPRTAAVTKLVGNSFIIGFAELVAETLALGEASGVPTAAVGSLMTQMFPGPIPQGANATHGRTKQWCCIWSTSNKLDRRVRGIVLY